MFFQYILSLSPLKYRVDYPGRNWVDNLPGRIRVDPGRNRVEVRPGRIRVDPGRFRVDSPMQ